MDRLKAFWWEIRPNAMWWASLSVLTLAAGTLGGVRIWLWDWFLAQSLALRVLLFVVIALAVVCVLQTLTVVRLREKLKNHEIRALKDELQALRLQRDDKPVVAFHDGASWKKLPDGTEVGPFCPGCSGEGRLLRGQVNEVDSGHVDFFCNHKSHKNPFVFRVPEALVKDMDLSSYKIADPGFCIMPGDRGGPDGWMGN